MIMKIQFPFSRIWLGLLIGLWLLPAARAFPPAPDGLIYGMVKDQYGTPLMNPADRVILITASGIQVATTIQPGMAIGVNFALSVPMDAGITPDPYVANALTAATQFKLYVAVGTTTNLPIEMTGGYILLGSPAQQTRQDLTLGVDANGDGIPDAWENNFMASLGTNIALANIKTSADYAHDGRSLNQEYLLGNYPFDPEDSFSVQLIRQAGGSAVLGFTTMLGRSYTALGSSDLKTWTSLSFTIPGEAATPPVHAYYYAPDIRPLQIQTLQPTNAPAMQFFKLQLQ
jgi:hypothetical protein